MGRPPDPGKEEGPCIEAACSRSCRPCCACGGLPPGPDRASCGAMPTPMARSTSSDPVATLFWRFLGGPALPCLDAADADDNGAIEVTDAVRTLEYLSSKGEAARAARSPTAGRIPPATRSTAGRSPPARRTWPPGRVHGQRADRDRAADRRLRCLRLGATPMARSPPTSGTSEMARRRQGVQPSTPSTRPAASPSPDGDGRPGRHRLLRRRSRPRARRPARSDQCGPAPRRDIDSIRSAIGSSSSTARAIPSRPASAGGHRAGPGGGAAGPGAGPGRAIPSPASP